MCAVWGLSANVIGLWLLKTALEHDRHSARIQARLYATAEMIMGSFNSEVNESSEAKTALSSSNSERGLDGPWFTFAQGIDYVSGSLLVVGGLVAMVALLAAAFYPRRCRRKPLIVVLVSLFVAWLITQALFLNRG
jgi:hypothetical protein